jgi:hypothetical protein
MNNNFFIGDAIFLGRVKHDTFASCPILTSPWKASALVDEYLGGLAYYAAPFSQKRRSAAASKSRASAGCAFSSRMVSINRWQGLNVDQHQG